MANQWGDTRIYTDTSEKTASNLVACPMCHVSAVPKGICDSRKINGVAPTDKTYCPNCGHVYILGYTVATQKNPAE